MTNCLCILYIKQKLFPGYMYKHLKVYASTKKSIQKEVSFCVNMLLVGKLKRIPLAEQVVWICSTIINNLLFLPKNHIQHELKNIWLDLVQNDSMIKCPIILRIILVYHIATAYLPTFCIMIMAIHNYYSNWWRSFWSYIHSWWLWQPCQSCTHIVSKPFNRKMQSTHNNAFIIQN